MITTAFITIFVLSFVYSLVSISVIILLLDYLDNRSKNIYSISVLTIILFVLSCYIVYMIYS